MGCAASKAQPPPVPDELHEGQLHALDVEAGMFVILDGVPCEVVEVATLATKRPGVMKRTIKGKDVFLGHIRMTMSYTTSAVTTVEVTRATFTLSDEGDDEDEGNYTLTAPDGSVRRDLTYKDCEENVKMKITQALLEDKKPVLTVVKVGDKERIVQADLQ